MQIRLKRAYEKPADDDGRRFLIDRIWPRGVGREALKIDAWLKEIAPSTELRRWFGHDPEKWEEFKRRYFLELDTRPPALQELRSRVAAEPVTLVYGASDEQHNNAVALREYLEAPQPDKDDKIEMEG
jgi:uncharacterized protein YeaO (DUF488 family)